MKTRENLISNIEMGLGLTLIIIILAGFSDFQDSFYNC